MTAYPQTDRNRVRRVHQRAHYDRETVFAVLDASLLAHIGYVIDGQPYVTPTCIWREGETLYWHGSSASRMLRAQSEGIPVCVTAAHLDGLVLARSGFHHSINYRSVMAFGRAHLVEDEAKKIKALDAFVDRIFPNRAATLRPMNAQEVKATKLMAMEIVDAVAKIRSGPPKDEAEDYDWPVWAGVIPIHSVVGASQTDPLLRADHPAPGEYQEGQAFNARFAQWGQRYESTKRES